LIGEEEKWREGEGWGCIDVIGLAPGYSAGLPLKVPERPLCASAEVADPHSLGMPSTYWDMGAG
jgi:hypothetical protein